MIVRAGFVEVIIVGNLEYCLCSHVVFLINCAVLLYNKNNNDSCSKTITIYNY